MTVEFPEAFVWGAATASYQIEGGVREGGRGESIWDRFSHTPGKIQNGDTGDVACDHYHRYAEDVELMAELGLTAYRFSIAWPRIFPEGKGRINPQGLDFYNRLVDCLLEASIEPFATLYHWDLPQALQEEGGWANRDTVGYFADYTAAMSRELGDRIHHWITHNEPWVVAFLGHATGEHAPGLKDSATALQVAHHLLLSHGEAVPILREHGDADTRVGITLNLHPVHPASESQADEEAARRVDGNRNRWFLDPLFKGRYPEDMLDWYDDKAPNIRPGDLDRIAVPTDFLGVNYYFRDVVEAAPQEKHLQANSIKPQGAEYTEMGWEIYPEGLYELLMRLHREYQVSRLYVTENGAAFADELGADGQVHDPRRVKYLQEHFVQAHRAIQDGAPLAGYFVWTLLDNFEWAFGYSKRFGLIYVDYPTQERIVKESGRWYREVIAENRVRI